MSPNVPVRANEPNFRANSVHMLYDLTLFFVFLGLSGLSFDGEGRRKGRVEILETPDLCRSGGTVCLLTSPCAQMNPIFVRILFICCMTLLSVIFLGLSGFCIPFARAQGPVCGRKVGQVT